MSRTVFVGNLPLDTREREIEDLFYKFGKIDDIDLKLPSRPPGFCFIEYRDPRDAIDAVESRDGYDFGGERLRVELARSFGRGRGGPPPPRSRGGYGGGYGGGYDDRGPPRGGGGGGGYGGAAPKSSGYRVIVTGLPKSASWQDLKDHFRRAGEVTFTQTFRDGSGTTGIVDFPSRDDMKYAIRKLDDSEFKNPFERNFIRVREEKAGRSASRSRSRGRSYDSRSRSRSPRSRSGSPAKAKSASPAVNGSPVAEAAVVDDKPERSASRSRSRSRS